jgi:hypothetical protein
LGFSNKQDWLRPVSRTVQRLNFAHSKKTFARFVLKVKIHRKKFKFKKFELRLELVSKNLG